MHSLTLEHDNRDQIGAALAAHDTVVACLCAAWCGTCGSYRATFEAMAARHPEVCFVWSDIEDQADVVGDLDVENFPTLLIQRADTVAFFGTVLPDPQLAERLLHAQLALSADELASQVGASAEKRDWQVHCNLHKLIAAPGG